MLKSVSKELNALMSRQSVSLLSSETAMSSSVNEDYLLSQLNAVALELINIVYGQVKEKLTALIR